MAFKHFKNRLASADTDVSLYTVPSGREFVLMKMRVRNVDGASSTNTMTFKTVEGGQTNTIGEISIQSDEISKQGASIKRLMDAGSVIMARASISGMMAEAMGVEFNAGVWSTIHEWGGSSSSSEQSSSSSSEQSSSSYSEQESSIVVSFATNKYNFSGNYTYNSSSNRYERTDDEVTYTLKYYGNSTTTYWEFERSDWDGNYIYYNTNDSTVSGITGTYAWTGFGALVEGESFTVTITAMQESSSSEQQGGGGQNALLVSGNSTYNGTYTLSSDTVFGMSGYPIYENGSYIICPTNDGSKYWGLYPASSKSGIVNNGCGTFELDNVSVFYTNSSGDDPTMLTWYVRQPEPDFDSITVSWASGGGASSSSEQQGGGGESVIDGPYSVWVSNFGSGSYVKTSDTCNSHYVYHCSDNGRYLFVTYGEGTYQWAMNTSKIETVQGDMPMMLNCWSSATYADATSVPGSPVGNYFNPPMGTSATVQLND